MRSMRWLSASVRSATELILVDLRMIEQYRYSRLRWSDLSEWRFLSAMARSAMVVMLTDRRLSSREASRFSSLIGCANGATDLISVNLAIVNL